MFELKRRLMTNRSSSDRPLPGLRTAAAGMGILALLLSGCASPRKIAINMVGDALAGTGTTFAADPDPELVKEAVPFGLKLMEALLAETPEHKDLLLAATSGFTQYAYAFVEPKADKIEDVDFDAAEATRARARKLYLRARDYGLRSLEVRHKGISQRLLTDPTAAVAATGKKDVPNLYWTAAAWGAAISLGLDDPELVADMPAIEAMIDRALDLDEDYEAGAIHTFLITYEMIRQGTAGEPADRARKHFDRFGTQWRTTGRPLRRPRRIRFRRNPEQAGIQRTARKSLGGGCRRPPRMAAAEHRDATPRTVAAEPHRRPLSRIDRPCQT